MGLYRMMTEKNTNKFLNQHKKIITSYNMRPHIGLNGRTPRYVHFLKDRRKINVIAKEIFKIHAIKKNTSPITYKLKDLSNELIKGSFYFEELVETSKPDFFPNE